MRDLPLFASRPLSAATLTVCVVISGCGGSKNSYVSPPPTPTPPPSAACMTPQATISHSGSPTNAAQIVFLDPAKYPQARCNDGTSPAYVLRPGVGAAASRWVILLEGGDDCYDQPSCSARAVNNPKLISSNSYQNPPASVLALSGIQSASSSINPDFYDATQVQALYCSSDDWSGAKTGTGSFNASDDATWNFQGHAIVAAILADLEANHGLSSATEVLFTGESAGGVGVFANVNTVAKLVPPTARFVSSSDAAFGNVVNDFDPSGAPPNYVSASSSTQISERTLGLALWNGSGDSACNAAAATPTEQVYCYSAQQLLGAGGTITLPMFVSEAQQDTAQLATAGVKVSDLQSGTPTAAETGYVSYFAAQMRAGLASTNADVSIFSPDILAHTEGDDNTLFDTSYTFPSGDTTLQQQEGAWYRNPCAPQRNIASSN